MISETCNFKDFLETVRDMGGFEMMELTHQEATRVERLCISRQYAKTDGVCDCSQYTKMLKGFILFLRHGVKVSSIKDIDLDGFERICWQHL